MQVEINQPPLPLRVDEHGVVRFSSSRVTLQSVITPFQDGACAEEIAALFPRIPLADIYAVVAYFLRNRQTVETYLEQQAHDADKVRSRVQGRFPVNQFRDRLLARRKSLP